MDVDLLPDPYQWKGTRKFHEELAPAVGLLSRSGLEIKGARAKVARQKSFCAIISCKPTPSCSQASFKQNKK